VNVRFERSALNQIDAWIARQPEPRPSRPEAIRLLLADAIGADQDDHSFNEIYDYPPQADGRAGFRLQTKSGRTLDIKATRNEIVSIVRYLLEKTSELPAAGDQAVPQNEFDAIGMIGIALAPGREPNVSLLVIRLEGIDLAFSAPSDELASKLSGLSRTASVMVADDTKPQ